MEFEKALSALKKGHKITNTGWNGKGMYVCMMPGYPEGVQANENFSIATGTPIGTEVKISPYFVLKNAQGEYVPWIPSTGDLLSDEWEVIQNGKTAKNEKETSKIRTFYIVSPSFSSIDPFEFMKEVLDELNQKGFN